MEEIEISELVERFKKELDASMTFWVSHSHDLKHG